LFTVLSACGDDGGARKLADAPPAPDDAQPDAPPAATTVNITAYARYFEQLAAMTPREGARVFALDPANNVVATAMTGPDGRTSVELPNGGSVTIAYPDTADGPQYYRSWVTTYVGVKPGDNLIVGDSFSENLTAGASVGTETVQWPALANATSYRLYVPCDRYGYFTPPTVMTTIDLYANCATTGPLVLVGYQAGNVIGSIYKASASHAADATHDLAEQGWTTQADAPNFISVLTGLPADADVRWLGAYGNYGPWSTDQVTTDIPVDNGMASAMSSVSNTAPRKTAVARVARTAGNGRQFFATTGTSPVSIAAGSLPMFDEFPAVDIKARKVTWPMPVGTYDHTILQFQWSYLVGDDTHRLTWNVILPPGVTELDAATVPAALQQFVPPATEFNLVNVRVVDLASAASYDAARSLPEWQLSYPIESVHTGAHAGAAYADGGEGSNIWEPYSIPH
jgi:hypothetical protein